MPRKRSWLIGWQNARETVARTLSTQDVLFEKLTGGRRPWKVRNARAYLADRARLVNLFERFSAAVDAVPG